MRERSSGCRLHIAGCNLQVTLQVRRVQRSGCLVHGGNTQAAVQGAAVGREAEGMQGGGVCACPQECPTEKCRAA